MFQVTIQFATAEAAIIALSLLRGTDNPPAVITQPDTKAEAGKGKGKAAKDTPAATTVETAASNSAPDADKASAANSQADASAVEYAVVAKAITDGVQVNKPKVVETLGKFSAKTGKDLKPEAYGDFLEALAEALKPGDDLT